MLLRGVVDETSKVAPKGEVLPISGVETNPRTDVKVLELHVVVELPILPLFHVSDRFLN